MTATFEFHRSTYNPLLDSFATPLYTPREVITSIGSNGGNFFNWANGTFYTGNTDYPLKERGVVGDNPDPATYSEFPLLVSKASVEVYIRGYWNGVTGAITNIRFLCTLLNVEGYGDGAYVNGRVVDQYPNGNPDIVGGVNVNTYAGPLIYWPDHPSHDPSVWAPMQQSQDPNQGYLDLTPGYETTQYSRYAVLQLVTGPNAQPGDGGRSSFTLYYDES